MTGVQTCALPISSYTATDGNSGTLPAITTTSTINLPVAEVQTLTTNHNNPRQN